MDPQQPETNPDKPIAYDANGQPLYAAPPPPAPEPASRSSHVTSAPDSHEGHNFDPKMRVQYANEPRVVHNTRQYDPVVGEVGEELQRKHDESAKMYPHLNLSAGEYVILSIKRHPIGLVVPTAVTIILIFLLLAALVLFPTIAADRNGEVPGLLGVTVMVFSMIILIGIGGYIAVWVYLKNTFYLTNESIVQEIQHSLFSRHEQTVSLGSIEDASFKQNGIVQTFFNYGTIRLSTEGEESTYLFRFVSNPKSQIATVNNAIESFKNGRPVGDD